MVADDEMGHGLDHRNGTRQDTGVVTATGGEFRGLALDGHGLLDLGDRCGRLEGDAEEDRFPVADTALDTAGAIGRGMDLAPPRSRRRLVCSCPFG